MDPTCVTAHHRGPSHAASRILLQCAQLVPAACMASPQTLVCRRGTRTCQGQHAASVQFLASLILAQVGNLGCRTS